LLQFRAVIEIRGINPYVFVDAKRASRLKEDWRKPLPVLVRINGQPKQPWCINMMPAGDGSYYLYLHETVRKASKTKAGDRVAVELSFDDAYRSGPRILCLDGSALRWLRIPKQKRPGVPLSLAAKKKFSATSRP
jgi:hypothetical protein